MIRTLIADDDALLRAALRTMVDWEEPDVPEDAEPAEETVEE